jgi:hypothetical protein
MNVRIDGESANLDVRRIPDAALLSWRCGQVAQSQGLMTDRKPKAAGEIQWINKLFDVAA